MDAPPDPQPSSAAAPPAEPRGEAGRLLFGRYRLERELGRGGMGRVLLAYDMKLHIPVAIKLVPDIEAVADLRREVLRGMALNHPAIVRTHTFEHDERAAAIVMEYVDGCTLTELKEAQPGSCFEPAQLASVIEELCMVLDHAHQHARIVHRDLKPRNLMLTRTGRLKVADFGISATLSDAHTRTTHAGVTSGTPPYMSPQQARGRRPSPADDIYSFGATLYELFTGKPPFFRGDLLLQLLEEIPPPLAERRAELGAGNRGSIAPAWETLVAACLAKDPAQRPASATALRELVLAAAAAAPPATGSRPGLPLAALVDAVAATRRGATTTVPLILPAPARPSGSETAEQAATLTAQPPAAARRRWPRRWWLASAAVAGAAGTLLWWPGRPPSAAPGATAGHHPAAAAGAGPARPAATVTPATPAPSAATPDPPGPRFTLGQILRQDGPGSGFTLEVPIACRAPAGIRAGEVELQAHFYERDAAGQLQRVTDAVRARWLSAPIDWAGAGPERLGITYTPVQNAAPLAGYILRLSYAGEAQAEVADPPGLLTAEEVFATYAMQLRERALRESGPQLNVPTTTRSLLSPYQWKHDIVATIFWVGRPAGGKGQAGKTRSAWDPDWPKSYGGYDDPTPAARYRGENGEYRPKAFVPAQNPFYCALPYNDLAKPGVTKPEARTVIPWFKAIFLQEGQSVCRDRWVALRNRHNQRIAYAQWADAGPARTDHWGYVFADLRPKATVEGGAGVSVSPAVRDYLDCTSPAVLDWRFADAREVPPGPWRLHGANNPFTRATPSPTPRALEIVPRIDTR